MHLHLFLFACLCTLETLSPTSTSRLIQNPSFPNLYSLLDAMCILEHPLRQNGRYPVTLSGIWIFWWWPVCRKGGTSRQTQVWVEPGRPVIWPNFRLFLCKTETVILPPYQGFLCKSRGLLWRLEKLMSLRWGTSLEWGLMESPARLGPTEKGRGVAMAPNSAGRGRPWKDTLSLHLLLCGHPLPVCCGPEDIWHSLSGAFPF